MKRKSLVGKKLKAYNYQHSKQRAKERYDISLTKSNYEALCDRIKAGRFVFVLKKERQKRGTQLTCQLRFKEQNIYVVYLVETASITTFLPCESFE